MMALLFGYSSNLISENESVFEIGKNECARDVVIVDDLPMRNLAEKPIKLHALQGGRAATTGNAMFGGQSGHEYNEILAGSLSCKPAHY